MGWWKNFLDSLDTPGGHILVFAFFFASGAALYALAKIDFGKEVMAGSFSCVMYACRGQEKANGKTPIPPKQ